MTLQELCKRYDLSETTVKKTFPRTQKSILKHYGVKIVKVGRGDNATYEEVWEDDGRATSMYEEMKDTVIIDNVSFKLMNWDFLVFLAIVITPMVVFRGSYADFLRYVQVPVTKQNISILKEALRRLSARDFICYTVDKTDDTYFIAALYRKVEEDMHIGIGMVKTCKRLADKYKKKSWVPLLKTWLGVQVLCDRTYTLADLEKITGLSRYQIKESNQILKEAHIFTSTRAYRNYLKCLGLKADINAFMT